MSKEIVLWRLARETGTYHALDLSGIGAMKFGGRWNYPGVALLYASTSVALCALEVALHNKKLYEIRDLFLVAITVSLRDWTSRTVLDSQTLPLTWASMPESKTAKDIGTAWCQGGSSLLLQVPSVIIPEEHNLLVNASHPRVKTLRATVVRQFNFDPRLKT